jgi:hypothetical protein
MTDRPFFYRSPLHPSRQALRVVYGPPEPRLAATLMAIVFAATGGLIVAGACAFVLLALIGAI